MLYIDAPCDRRRRDEAIRSAIRLLPFTLNALLSSEEENKTFSLPEGGDHEKTLNYERLSLRSGEHYVDIRHPFKYLEFACMECQVLYIYLQYSSLALPLHVCAKLV